MKRICAAALTCAVLGFALAPLLAPVFSQAFADEPDFKTTEGIKKFWDRHVNESGGGGGN
jgi:hypothetical protein